MKFLKITAVAALAISLVGCGKQSDSKANSASSANAYQPQIVEGSTIAVQFRKSSSPVFEPITKIVAESKALAMTVLSMQDVEGVAKFSQFMTESGLDNADLQWVVVSVGGLTREVFAEKDDALPEIAVALSLKHDMERVIGAIRARLTEDQQKELVETTVADVKAWKIVADDLAFEPSVASLNGSLMLFAVTPELLERQIKLYRDGVGVSKAIAPDDSAVLRVAVSEVGNLTKMAMDEDSPDRAYMDKALPIKGITEILDNLGTFDLTLTATDEAATCKTTLECKTEEDAKAMVTISDFLQLALKQQLVENSTSDDPMARLVADVLASTKTTADGKVAVCAVTLKREFIAELATLCRAAVMGIPGVGGLSGLEDEEDAEEEDAAEEDDEEEDDE